MSELQDLYQAVILDHNRAPKNFGKLEDATHEADGHNPLCGDRLHVTLALEGDTIADIKFDGSGCAISKASASLMTAALKGKSVKEADALFGKFHQMCTIGSDDEESLGKLSVFSGVREFPMRVKCATLSWHTVQGALHESGTSITTE